ncbi:MAG: hypothetical protein IJB07_04635 [Firmicutes bacterium]|nr:hypothetical protein [Bacillota bacterium]
MIDILEDWIVNSVPEGQEFKTAPQLIQKVDPEGRILPFRGITVVFRLPSDVVQYLSFVQDRLYETCGHLLAERLSPDSFHMTLHDIAAAPPCEQIETDIEYYQPRVCDALNRLKRSLRPLFAEYSSDLKSSKLAFLGQGLIPVQGTHLFNMCHTSIVLGVDADDPYSDLLCTFRKRFDQFRDQGTTWTPHITLAYFKPKDEPYTEEELRPLREALTKEDILFNLHLSDLEVQSFTDMNHYETL